jgi:DNA (cytosine-5)-methyltransferase 1
MYRPTVGSLFTGIGGLDLGFEWAGFDVMWQCESDPYCRRVLAHHWPDVICYDDVATMPNDVRPVDVVTGGFPCQPVSLAGLRRGANDDRWLWPEMARIVRLLRPRIVVVENVPGIFVRGLGDVLGQLAACGYDTEWDCIPAASVGAPHLRYRVFVVAYADGVGREVGGIAKSAGLQSPRGGVFDGRGGPWWFDETATADDMADADVAIGDQWDGLHDVGSTEHGRRGSTDGGGSRDSSDADFAGLEIGRLRQSVAEHDWWTVEPNVGRMANGVPDRVDRLRALGNAVVPQVAEWIARRLLEQVAW